MKRKSSERGSMNYPRIKVTINKDYTKGFNAVTAREFIDRNSSAVQKFLNEKIRRKDWEYIKETFFEDFPVYFANLIQINYLTSEKDRIERALVEQVCRNGNITILAGAKRFGKCLNSSAYLYSDGGEMISVKDIVKNNLFPRVLTLDVTNMKIIKSWGRRSYQGRHPTLKLTTESGREIICTHAHPFLKFYANCKNRNRQWTKATKLKKGDFIATAGFVPEPVNPAPLGRWKVEFLGYMLGGGTRAKNRNNDAKYVFTTSSQKTKRHFLSLLEKFNNSFRIYHKDKIKKREVINISIKQGNASDFLRGLGIFDVDSRTKFIPSLIFKASNRVLAVFIKGIWETDGWCYKTNSKNVNIGYGSCSRRLIDGLQCLLLRFRIYGKIYKKKNFWTLQVSGSESKLQFLRLFYPEFAGFYQKKMHIDYQNDVPTGMIESDMIWEEITEIKKNGIEEVYDIEVPYWHNFIANGIVCHNSATLLFLAEQARAFGLEVFWFGYSPALKREYPWIRQTFNINVESENGLMLFDETNQWLFSREFATKGSKRLVDKLPTVAHRNMCLPVGAEVRTSDGIKALSELNNSVNIASYDFSRQHVLFLPFTKSAVQRKKTLCIKFTDGSVLECSPEHRFPVFDGKNMSIKQAKTLNNKDYIVQVNDGG